MSLTISFDELLRYSNEEREKWREWFVAHPDAMAAPVQPADSRHQSVGGVIDHIFLVERRHLQRLTHTAVDSQTGLSGRHAPPLFDYGASVRRELEQFASDLDPDVADEPFSVTVASGGQFNISPRKLLFHCLLHEVRHWAQIALAVRLAGFAPPGNHDLFYSRAFR